MIPDYQTLMLPLLQAIGDGREYYLRDVIDALADRYKLTEDERRELLPSGQQSIFDNRVGWARTYLKKAGLVDSTRRGYFKITARGREVLAKPPEAINIRFLKQYPEFIEFQKIKNVKDSEEILGSLDKFDSGTPEDMMANGYLKLHEELASELLANVKKTDPAFFEKLVVELIVKMGYGGSRRDAGMAIGKSGDGGVDGLIKEDKLGLDVIYIQAKRWENTVPIKEIRDFAGALMAKKSRKGIFITTSDFPSSADDFVKSIDLKITLIDGKRLVNLMIENGIGVSLVTSYDIHRLDMDYFTDTI